MMSKGLSIKSTLFLAGLLGIGPLFASTVHAQVIHPDDMIGVPSLQSESVPQGRTMPNEPGAGDLEQGFDRQMVMPEADSSGGIDMNMLKTPDATDAENARESDSQSAVSF